MHCKVCVCVTEMRLAHVQRTIGDDPVASKSKLLFPVSRVCPARKERALALLVNSLLHDLDRGSPPEWSL